MQDTLTTPDSKTPNCKSIDSLLIDVTTFYPAQLKKITLSSGQKEYKDQYDYARLVSIEGDAAQLIVSQDIYKKICIVHATTTGGATVKKRVAPGTTYPQILIRQKPEISIHL